MVDVPDFGFASMSHQQLADLIRAAPSAEVNAPVADRLTMIAQRLDHNIERIQRAMSGGALNWSGPAAAAADQLINSMSEFSRQATEQAAFFHEQAAQQSEGAQWVRTTMPTPVPNPLASAPDFGSQGLIGLTESLVHREAATTEAGAQAHEIMDQWARTTVARVNHMSTMDPLPPAPGPATEPGHPAMPASTGEPAKPHEVASPAITTHSSAPASSAPASSAPAPTGAGSTTPALASPGQTGPGTFSPTPNPAQNQGPGVPVVGLIAQGPRNEPERIGTGKPGGAITGEPLRANPGVPKGATESVRSGRPISSAGSQDGRAGTPGGAGRRAKGEADKEHRRRYGVESDEYFDVDQDEDGVLLDPGGEGTHVVPPVIGER